MAAGNLLEPPKSQVEVPHTKPRKKLVRRTDTDYSQRLRRVSQLAFLALNLFVGALFYVWVRQFEAPGSTLSVSRPAGVEGFLPIAGLMNVKLWILSGRVPEIHPAAMFLFLAICAIAFFFRKAFCSWLCPVGTVSEWLWQIGRKVFRNNWALPRWLDIPLRTLKYLLLAFFAWAVYTMSPAAIDEFMRTPYGLIVDVKMLNFFRYLGETAIAVLLFLAVASMVVKNFWCRYLCPYGGLLGLLSCLSPVRIRRERESCIDCAKCAKACPASLRVDKLVTIRSAECTGCLECTAACPAQGALAISVGLGMARRNVRPWAIAAGVALLFLGTVVCVKISGHWDSAVTNMQYQQVISNADDAVHPVP
jgi:polyferredoxin